MTSGPAPHRAMATFTDDASVSTAYVAESLRIAEDFGIPVASIPAGILADSNPVVQAGEMPVSRYARMLDHFAERRADPAFGLEIGARRRLSSNPLSGIIMSTSAHLGDMIENSIRYGQLDHDLGAADLQIERDDAVLRWHAPFSSLQGGAQVELSILAQFQAMTGFMLSEKHPFGGIELVQSEPETTARRRMESHFGGDIRFGAKVTTATVSAGKLMIPIRSANPALLASLRARAEQILAEKSATQRKALTEQVKHHIRENLEQQDISVGSIALVMNLSARMLQNRLSDLGVTFSALVNDARKELALHCLDTTTMTITQISIALGYAEQSSFNHAFRSWFGVTPTAWRQRAACRE